LKPVLNRIYAMGKPIIIKLLKGFAYLWGSIIMILVWVNIIILWYQEGFWAVQELLSPFNIIYYFQVALTLSPAIGANILAEKLEME